MPVRKRMSLKNIAKPKQRRILPKHGGRVAVEKTGKEGTQRRVNSSSTSGKKKKSGGGIW